MSTFFGQCFHNIFYFKEKYKLSKFNGIKTLKKKHLLHKNINTSMDQNITPGFDIGHFTNIKACIFFSQ